MLTTTEDFQQLLSGCCYRNYLADPMNGRIYSKSPAMMARGAGARCFRPKSTRAMSRRSAMSRPTRRLQRVYPLNRRYNVVHRNLYKVHQRVAATFRKGRVFLAGDSAHVNNSVGGLGLNSGIHDAMELTDTLREIIEAKLTTPCSSATRAGAAPATSNRSKSKPSPTRSASKSAIPRRARRASTSCAPSPRTRSAQGIPPAHLTHRQRAQSPKHRLILVARWILANRFSPVTSLARHNLVPFPPQIPRFWEGSGPLHEKPGNRRKLWTGHGSCCYSTGTRGQSYEELFDSGNPDGAIGDDIGIRPEQQ